MTTHLEDYQLEACKRYLTKRQSRLIQHLHQRYDIELAHPDAVGELSSYDNHPGDLGSELFERGKDLALMSHLEQELEAINDALHAIHEGTYGLCRVCSLPIPYERLQSNPTADTCIEHAKEASDKANFDYHSEVNPHLNPIEENSSVMNFYDQEDAWQDVARFGTSDTPSDVYDEVYDPEEAYANSDEHIGFVEDVEQYPDEQKE